MPLSAGDGGDAVLQARRRRPTSAKPALKMRRRRRTPRGAVAHGPRSPARQATDDGEVDAAGDRRGWCLTGLHRLALESRE